MPNATMLETDPPEFDSQQAYYAQTADQYDDWHNAGDDEHDFALAWLIAYLRHSDARSLLDIGSGTGRALVRIKAELPHVRIVGVEPSPELRAIGHEKHGLQPEELVDGNALQMEYDSGAFDIVSEFGALHHIKAHGRAVGEMLRVARHGIFISDTNNFGQGSRASRAAKQVLNALRLWPVAVWLKTRGKMYHYSESDGIYYSYSVFDDYPLIRRQCARVHLLNTLGEAANPYRAASHVALLGLKG